jgi:phenylpyruvate tautomerase PptA (4-oxalocrotonate tautomerase family)
VSIAAPVSRRRQKLERKFSSQSAQSKLRKALSVPSLCGIKKNRMPLLKLETTVALNEEKQKSLLSGLSRTVAETTGKPEQYVMITASHSSILMSGKPGDAAFVDVRGIGGLTGSVNRQLTEKICRLLNQSLGVPANRIYLNFTDVEGGNWGWDGNTFG